MSESKVTFQEGRRINQRNMYADYIKKIKEDPNINKSELKRKLADTYGYLSETSVNTIIWKIENKAKTKTNKDEN